MVKDYEKRIASGTTYKVCGMSLQQLNINQATLVNGVEVIPKDLGYLFDQQQQG
jgi:intracellular sulfur oxidation DsrE/DsrF family protein